MSELASVHPESDRQHALALDRRSPLADRRNLFEIPDGTIYLDGNSLGAMPTAVPQRLAAAVSDEWAQGLISSWNTAGWIDLPRRVAVKIAPLLGVPGSDVFVGDSTSVSLFKTIVSACRLRPGRKVIVMESTTFPTDGYIATAAARMLGAEMRWCDPSDPTASIDEDVAVVCLTHVDFRTGAMFDMAAVTAAAHHAGALMLWDLCHSAGAVPVGLADHDVDLAVGCTYKYLNGGPGSPAFIYVSPRHQGDLDQPLPGWMGHARPFDMERDYEPVVGVGRMASGTPQVIALSALDAALDAFDGVDLAELRAGSLSLTDYFIERVESRLGQELELLTPREPSRRGSQVSLRHPEAYGVVQALIERGVIGDFRTPDVARFGFTPMYVTHADVFDAVEHLAAVMADQEYTRPSYAIRHLVT